jgi:AcrR family transcriptional regulator
MAAIKTRPPPSCGLIAHIVPSLLQAAELTKSTSKARTLGKLRKGGAKTSAPPKRIGRPRGQGVSQQRILAIATKMFADRGYAALSIRDIAAASQLNIPSIYHFFGGKENLYRSCCTAAFASVSAKLGESLVSAPGPRARIKAFAVMLCEVLLENREFRRLLLQEIIMRDESRHFEELSTNFFLPEFRALVGEIAALEGERDAAEQAFSVYALTFGLILLRRTFAVAGVDQAAASSPVSLAERVLGIVLPRQKWNT